MILSLSERHKDYEQSYDHQIIKKLPIICRVDGRSFSRYCKNLKKPYEPILLEAMAETMFFAVTEMSGAVFAYTASDEITFILKNDQTLESEPWYNNKIQDIVSVTSSLVTLGFNKVLSVLGNVDTKGDAVFKAKVFAVPNVSEAVNNLISRQLICIKSSFFKIAETHLSKKYNKKSISKMMEGLSFKEKQELLYNECKVDFLEYPSCFRLGVAAYKVPIIIPTKTGDEVTRKKWKLDWNISNFIDERDFIYNIILNGQDIFRAENI